LKPVAASATTGFCSPQNDFKITSPFIIARVFLIFFAPCTEGEKHPAALIKNWSAEEALCKIANDEPCLPFRAS
jgi:hypothetical protein